MKKITTRVLPGFMELLPPDQIAFNKMLAVIQGIYELYGFIPIDTPVIEKSEILLAKAGGETEKQIYRFLKGENDLALRFDLTVPLARYVSEHSNDLIFPFRRYHIGKVYRGESAQRGRYREFYQCDIDIIGKDSLSLINDAEILSVIHSVFNKLNFGPFIIRLSNRKLINGFTEFLGASDKSVEIMRIIDKIDKIGREETDNLLTSLGLEDSVRTEIFKFLEIKGSPANVIKSLQELNIKNDIFNLGVSEISDVVKYIKILGVPEDFYNIDLKIARGLDYYTGTVYETTLRDYPQLGSICSGGRYDNLAESYTDKKLPGVGISIGLTRLFSQLKENNLLKTGPSTTTRVLVIPLVPDISISLEITNSLRLQGIPTEIYLEDAKMKTKLNYANKLGIPYVVFVGEDEIKSGQFTIKNMKTGEQVKAPKAKIFSHILAAD